MSNWLFTKLLHDRPLIPPRDTNWQTNKPKQWQSLLMLCWFQKSFDLIWHEGLLYKLMESGVEGKTYDIIKSMYANNKCVVKIGKKTHISFHRAVGKRQECSLSPTFFNIYINELERALEQSAAPGLTLLESEVKGSTVCWWSGASVTNQWVSTAAPRSSAQILPDLGPDSKSQ